MLSRAKLWLRTWLLRAPVEREMLGVAPPRFAGTRPGGSQVRVWLPLSARALVQRTSTAALASYDSAFFGSRHGCGRVSTPMRVASLASWIPARRATQVDPLGMLRTE